MIRRAVRTDCATRKAGAPSRVAQRTQVSPSAAS